MPRSAPDPETRPLLKSVFRPTFKANGEDMTSRNTLRAAAQVHADMKAGMGPEVASSLVDGTAEEPFLSLGILPPPNKTWSVVSYDSTGCELHRSESLVSLPGLVAKKSLNAFTLLGVLFATSIGSGYGFEDAVGAAGPFITCVFCMVLPWLWCLPTGMAVSELSTSVQSNAGVLMWVNVAFSPTISFACLISSGFLAVVGTAAYPNLFADYVNALWPMGYWGTVAAKCGIVFVCAGLNIVGVEVVGDASIFSAIITLAPFVTMCVIQFCTGSPPISWAAVSYIPKEVDWATFLSIASWNFSNLDNAGSVAEEIDQPQKTLMRAMIPLMFSYYLAYMFPVVAGVSCIPGGAGQDWGLWKSGYWGTVAKLAGGAWLFYFMLSAALISAMGFLLSTLCCQSRVIAGMGSLGAFPGPMSKFLAHYNKRFGTPANAIIINSAASLVLCLSMSFREIIALNQIIYTIRLIFVYLTILKLRWSHPNLERPFKIPGNFCVALMVLAPSMLFCAVVCVVSLTQSKVTLVSGLLFFFLTTFVSFTYVGCFVKDGFVGTIQRVPFTLHAVTEADLLRVDDDTPLLRDNQTGFAVPPSVFTFRESTRGVDIYDPSLVQHGDSGAAGSLGGIAIGGSMIEETTLPIVQYSVPDEGLEEFAPRSI